MSIIIILLAPLALFAPGLLSGSVLLPLDLLHHHGPFSVDIPRGLEQVKNPHLSDLITIYYPWLEYFRTGKGFEFLWNPYSFCGSPLLANAQNGFFFPLTWLYLILPHSSSLLAIAVMKLAFCGIFAFLFYRELNLHNSACLLGALALTYGGHLVVWLGYPTSFPLVTLPFLFWSLERYLSVRSYRQLTIVALAYGLLFIGGQPQTGIIIALGSAVYLLTRLLRKNLLGLRPLLDLALAASLGFCLSAPQILPFLEYARESAAFHLRESFGWKTYPWYSLLSWIMPRFFGDVRDNNFWGFSSFLGEAVFVGGIPLILATMTLFRKKKNRFFWEPFVVLLFGILALYVAPAQILFSHVPLLRSIDNNKFLVLVTFGLVSLAASELSQLLGGKTSQQSSLYAWCGAALGWLAFVVIGRLYFRGAFSSLGLTNYIAKEFSAYASFLVISTILFSLWSVHRLRPVTFSIALILLSVCDLFRLWIGYYPSYPSQYAHPRSISIEFLQTRIGTHRVLGLDGFLPPETSILFRLQDMRGYDGLTPLRHYHILGRIDPDLHDLLVTLRQGNENNRRWTGRTLFYKSLERFTRTNDESIISALRRIDYWSQDLDRIDRPALLSILGVRYILAPLSNKLPRHAGFSLVHSSDAAVWENHEALPKAFVATRPTHVSNNAQALDMISEPNFDFRRTAVITGSNSILSANNPLLSERAELIPVTILQYKPDKVALAVDAPEGGWLVLSDLYYPGWSAFVDDRPAHIYPANYLFRGIELEPGRHHVEFTYRPTSFRISIILFISSAFIILCVHVIGKGKVREG